MEGTSQCLPTPLPELCWKWLWWSMCVFVSGNICLGLSKTRLWENICVLSIILSTILQRISHTDGLFPGESPSTVMPCLLTVRKLGWTPQWLLSIANRTSQLSHLCFWASTQAVPVYLIALERSHSAPISSSFLLPLLSSIRLLSWLCLSWVPLALGHSWQTHLRNPLWRLTMKES